MGKVRFFGVGTVGARWKKACETANVMVYYTKKDTGGLLNGEEGRESSRRATTVRTSGGSCSIPSQASDPLGLPASDSWKLAAGVTFRNWGQGRR